jgi:CHASE1-domain containing sensor protein
MRSVDDGVEAERISREVFEDLPRRLLPLLLIVLLLVSLVVSGCAQFRTGADPREFFETLERRSGGA